jgi:hypothetical protein
MRYLSPTILTLACSIAVLGQDTPKAEIFAGYSYGNYEMFSTPSRILSSNLVTTVSNTPGARLGVMGWNGSLAVTMNQWFGFATDISGYYSGTSASAKTIETLSLCTGCGTQVSTSVSTLMSPDIHNFLFGPQFCYRESRTRLFTQFLLGGELVSAMRMQRTISSVGILPPSNLVQSGHMAETGFAMAFGGGMDLALRRNLAWRLQADYLTSQAGLGQHHVRVSTGLVWRLGFQRGQLLRP